ncbi:MAG TPA: hypothetical protein DCP31_12625 [Cyanobacteria bacterium UBA8543]|nr:hypothetical protein [Cyanobacteria bacterium UBA8543]
MTKGRGRPKSDRNTKTVTLRLEPRDWELFRQKAKALGMSRSQLVQRLARGEIRIDSAILTEELLLGESSANCLMKMMS